MKPEDVPVVPDEWQNAVVAAYISLGLAPDGPNEVDIPSRNDVAFILAAAAPLIAAAEREACAEILQREIRVIYAKRVISKQNREVSHVLTMCRTAIRARGATP